MKKHKELFQTILEKVSKACSTPINHIKEIAKGSKKYKRKRK